MSKLWFEDRFKAEGYAKIAPNNKVFSRHPFRSFLLIHQSILHYLWLRTGYYFFFNSDFIIAYSPLPTSSFSSFLPVFADNALPSIRLFI